MAIAASVWYINDIFLPTMVILKDFQKYNE